MNLNFSPTPIFRICHTKRFIPGEKHCTRPDNNTISILILMMEGELRFLEDGKEIVLRPGEYYIQRHGLTQQGVPLNLPPIYFFVEFYATYSEGVTGLPIRGTFQLQKISPLIHRFESLFREHCTDLFKMNAYMLRIFSELLACNETANKKNDMAHLIKKHIHANYSSRISLTDIAEKFHYTEDYIVKIFKEQFGITPHQYLIKLRMEQARLLLEHSTLPIEEIALSVGYTDRSAFYRCFIKTFGFNPSSIRENAPE